MLLYSATPGTGHRAPGTESADLLRLLGVVGGQKFENQPTG